MNRKMTINIPNTKKSLRKNHLVKSFLKKNISTNTSILKLCHAHLLKTLQRNSSSKVYGWNRFG